MSTIPSYRSTGTYQHSTGSLSVSPPGDYAVDDLLVMFVESENQDIATPTGWTQISTAQGSGTAGNDAAVRLEVFYKIATNSEGPTVVSGSGDHTSAFIMAFSGVNTASPIDVSTGNTASSSTSVSCPAVTTTVANCLIVNAVSGSQDTTTAQAGSWANASLSNVTERADNYTTDAGGGGISVATGGKASAGSTGNTTATLSNASVQARITFAIKPQIAFTLTGDTGVVYVAGQAAQLIAPLDDLLLEDFEGTPPNSLLDWENGGGSSTVTLSTSHATEGTHSWRFQASTGSNALYTSSVFTLDPGYTEMTIDFYVQSIHANDAVSVQVGDAAIVTSGAGQTGAFTLTIDLTTLSTYEGIAMVILVADHAVTTGILSGNCDVYVDNVFLAGTRSNDDTLTGDMGACVIAGQAGSLKATRKITAAQGTVTVAGQSGGLLRSLVTAGARGDITVAGVAAALVSARKLAGDMGEILLEGFDATLTRTWAVVGAVGSVIVAGVSAGLLVAYKTAAAFGEILLEGFDAALARLYPMPGDAGTVLVEGQDAVLLATWKITGATGEIEIAGEDAGLFAGRAVVGQTGAIEVDGYGAVLLAQRKIAGAVGTIDVDGIAAGLLYDRRLFGDVGAIEVDAQAAGLFAGRAVVGTAGVVTVDGQDGAPLATWKIGAAYGAVTIEGIEAGFELVRKVPGATGVIEVDGQAAVLSELRLPSIEITGYLSGDINMSGLYADGVEAEGIVSSEEEL